MRWSVFSNSSPPWLYSLLCHISINKGKCEWVSWTWFNKNDILRYKGHYLDHPRSKPTLQSSACLILGRLVPPCTLIRPGECKVCMWVFTGADGIKDGNAWEYDWIKFPSNNRVPDIELSSLQTPVYWIYCLFATRIKPVIIRSRIYKITRVLI